MHAARSRRSLAASALLALAAVLLVPSAALASECSYGPGDGEWTNSRSWLVVVGTITNSSTRGFDVTVEAAYNPRSVTRTVLIGPLSSYSLTMDTEARQSFEVGRRYLVVAFANGLPEFGPPGWVAGPCQPSLPLDHPDAARRLAEAEAAFGSPVRLVEPPDTATVRHSWPGLLVLVGSLMLGLGMAHRRMSP